MGVCVIVYLFQPPVVQSTGSVGLSLPYSSVNVAVIWLWGKTDSPTPKFSQQHIESNLNQSPGVTGGGETNRVDMIKSLQVHSDH